MAKIIFEGNEKEITDGENIVDVAEELGVPMGCREGVCGTCVIEVLEGAENLNEPTQAEIDAGLEGNKRLACQVKIKSGEMKFKLGD